MRTQRYPILLFALALLIAVPASAQSTYTWAGGTGSWNDSARWSPTGVPAADDTVHISSGTTTLSGSTSVASLFLSGSGIVAGDADLTITDAMVWTGSSTRFDGTGTVTVAVGATLHMTGDDDNFYAGASRNFVNSGSAVWDSEGEWSGPGHFVNGGDLELAADFETSTRLCFSSTTDAIVNDSTGVIRRTGSGELVVYCPFSNHGRIDIDAGSFRMRDFNGNGGTDSGAYVVADDAVLHFDGRRTLTGTASVTGDGTIRTGGNSANPVTINGAVDVPVIEISPNVGLVLNADASVDTLRMGGAVGGSGTLTVTRELSWTRGYFEGTGTALVAEGATLSIEVQSSAGLRGSHRLINEGSATWTSTDNHNLSNGDDAAFENRGTMTVTATTESAFTDFFAGTFINAEGGILRRSGEGETRFGSGFENHGTVEILEGSLELKGFNATGGTDSGLYVLADSTRLELTGGVRTLAETATITGNGTVVMKNGSNWFSVTNNATWRPGASPGTLTIDSDYPADDGVLEIELGGYESGTQHDQLVVTGEAQLSGTLRVSLVDDFVPEAGDSILVLTAANIVGAFDAIELPDGVQGSVELTDTTAVLAISLVTANEEAPDAGTPTAFALHAPYPNPSAGEVAVAFDVATPGPVRLAVYDVLGRSVAVLADEERAAGRYKESLDGSGLSAGLYLVRLDAGSFTATRQVVIVR